MNRTSYCLAASFFCTLLAAFAGLSVRPADADPAFTTLYNFAPFTSTWVNTDGARPQDRLVQGRDGNFYGTIYFGGPGGDGAIFELTPSGNITTLHTFSAAEGPVPNTDGAFPTAGLVQGSDGAFYGTAYNGGSYGNGTIYRITSGGTFTLLHTFHGYTVEGGYPNAGLVLGSDGDFYGTTQMGGANSNGTIYKITPSGAFMTVYNFSAIDYKGANLDGTHPTTALLLAHDGNFYGTASGGGASGNGTVYRMTPQGIVTGLYGFSSLFYNKNADGANPNLDLIQGSDGSLYGGTINGGTSGYGTLFKMTPTGMLTTLVEFDGTNGNSPDGLVFGRDGNIYGVTDLGGVMQGAGTVFEMSPSGTFTVIHTFSPVFGPEPNNGGGNPFAGLVEGSNGSFYGTTGDGGANSSGTIFRIDVPPMITAYRPSEGAVGSIVTLSGTNLSGVTSVRFHHASALVFAANADGTQVTVTVPQGAAKGTITVTALDGTATTIAPFRVTYAPVITSFAPASGPVGTVVTITGTHLSGITRVRFHNADASVYSSNADGTQLTVTVPSGAATGTITLDNRDVLGTTSTGVFTVTH